VENLELTGLAAIHGSGNSLANSLLGNSGDNSLSGGAGDDTLNGGLGKDTLLGGAGDDLFLVNSSDDLVVENAAAGSDTVLTEASYTLAGNVENLVLGGSDTLSGSGNSLANSLLGNSADNTLSGDAGDDTLIGLAGNDSLAGGAGNDSLAGGEGADTLDGGAGANTLSGGTGDDAYVINSVEDEIIESTLSGGGTDTATAKISGYTLAANVENLVLANGVGSGTGNSLANSIAGDSGANRIDGGFDRLLVRHVERPEGSLKAARGKFRGKRPAFRLLHVKDRDLRPLLRHADHAGAPDSHRAASDGGNLSTKPVHAMSPFAGMGPVSLA
jgi:Ca2+-binding RTX toxin-like protein